MWINVQELDGTPVNGIYPNITFDFAIDTKWSTGVWFNNDFVKGQWVNVTCKNVIFQSWRFRNYH